MTPGTDIKFRKPGLNFLRAMYNPVSTYRIQFNQSYSFKNFKEDLEYFILLGPGSIYASPVFEAAPGSMHGYDVTNPLIINTEIGQYSDLIEITDYLKLHGIGWIQDIVPNHMAFHMNNKWLMDVLEKGEASEFAQYFDIDFSHPGFNGKVMVPFLGKKPEEAIQSGELTLDRIKDRFIFRYFDYYFPIAGESLPHISDDSYISESFIDKTISSINADKELLSELLDKQHYKLCYWRDSLKSINYRRFFTVNSLICLKMENDKVFRHYHEFIEKLVLEDRFNGLRIDHIDGLRRPVKYLENLRSVTGEEAFIIAEKILGADEELISQLPIQGTSGYDYLSIVNNLFTHKKNYSVLDSFYREITGIEKDVEEIIYDMKKSMLNSSMKGELENLSRLCDEYGLISYDNVVTRDSVIDAIGEFLIFFPVYKLYPESLDFTFEENLLMKEVFVRSVKKNPSIEKSINALENIFFQQEGFDKLKKDRALSFFQRCMQFTGPLMAKGVEDTAMYYFNSFIGHNEVGDHPGADGISINEYHERMLARQKNWPLSMNATSTHDTKRGEDVRARLNILTEIPEEWISNVREWMNLNAAVKTTVRGKLCPDKNEEYFIYQTLAGVFPFDGVTDDSFLERMDEYLIKALREARTNSNWNDPDEDYEKGIIKFTRTILDKNSVFLNRFTKLHDKISDYGILNSLNQLVLKSLSPGIPDFYQGTELWDLSLVDPDNRRPVDYSLRYKMLEEMIAMHSKNPERFFTDLFQNRKDGRIKFWLTLILLSERKSDPDLFMNGKYVPLKVKGKYAEHILAFARVYGNRWCIAVIPLFISMLPANKGKQEPGKTDWGNTRIILPDIAPTRWSVQNEAQEFQAKKELFIADVLKFPCPAFLSGKREKPVRNAGILAHITSLPGNYGTGDLGYEAYEFADILNDSGQSFWQILPFNPTEKGYGYSPYSSLSAFAGNLTLLSPELLVNSKLLQETSLMKPGFRESDRANFDKARLFRLVLLDEVFTNFFCSENPLLNNAFERFCENEKYWLDDYALFVCLKSEYKDLPWFEWPEDFKNRNLASMSKFIEKYEMEIKKEKLGQYLFHKQWIDLKKYCNNSGIKLIGDMSFYVNYDSADVWSHPEYFKLDDSKKPISVAGVPPDYFSSDGQLWGMPVYNWGKMEYDNYSWWMSRIKRNLELCDIVRFDHFRGFSDYWVVPYGEKTAVKGKWVAGPGHHFFNKVMKEFPAMPFIAEDLGDIDDKVYKLRDDFSLPGMVVLQFAFGDNTPRSIYIPHNHKYNSVVYTGTHDNNTIKGWYMNELSPANREEAEEYLGHFIQDWSAHEEFIKMAYGSVSKIVIIPIQDILGLDERARLNIPSTVGNNWDWKMKKSDLRKFPAEKMRRLAILYGRI